MRINRSCKQKKNAPCERALTSDKSPFFYFYFFRAISDPHTVRVELTTNQQTADSKAGSNSQQANNTSSQQRFEGWEFWDERYNVPPAMLSKKSCGKVCSDYPDLYKLLPEEYPNNREVFGSNKSCAIISSSKVLDKYEYGAQIDAHDVILRFNLHPIRDARREGRRTTTHDGALWVLERSRASVQETLPDPEQDREHHPLLRQNAPRDKKGTLVKEILHKLLVP